MDMGNSIRRYVGDKLIQTDPNIGINEPEFGRMCELLELKVIMGMSASFMKIYKRSLTTQS